jgi:hypothetical protein
MLPVLEDEDSTSILESYRALMDAREELAEYAQEEGFACFQVGFDAFNKPETLLCGTRYVRDTSRVSHK